MPALFKYMMIYMRWIFLFIFLFYVLTFVTSIGLLKRKNWARILFVTILSLGIVWNVLGFIIQLTVVPSQFVMPVDSPADTQAQFESILSVMTIIMGIMALFFTALFAWIIKRLLSAAVKQEFQAAKPLP